MQFQDMLDRLAERLDEDSAVPTYWSFDEITAALNEAQRFLCFLTLCIERTVSFTIPASTAFVPILSNNITPIADFIVPLKARSPSGVRMRPARLHELNLYRNNWMVTTDAVAPAEDVTQMRYSVLGCDLFFIYPQFAAGGTITLTYAAAPVPMTLTDTTLIPEPPVEYHQSICNYAIYLLTNKEGGAEFANEIYRLQDFLEDAQKLGEMVRSKMKAQRYETMPFDLGSRDLSPLFKTSVKRFQASASKRPMAQPEAA